MNNQIDKATYKNIVEFTVNYPLPKGSGLLLNGSPD